MSPKSHGTPRWVDYDLENQSLGRDWLSCRRSMIAGISESALLNTRCNVLSVPITIWPRMCLSELMRSAHCRSMQRWTLNGYMTLIRPTSLTRCYARISLRGICVLSVKSQRLGKFQGKQPNGRSNFASAEDSYRLFRTHRWYI